MPTSAWIFVHRRLAFVEIADIEFVDLDAGLRGEGLRRRVVVRIGGDDGAAGLLRALADSFPDAARSAGDQSNLLICFLPGRMLPEPSIGGPARQEDRRGESDQSLMCINRLSLPETGVEKSELPGLDVGNGA